VSAADVAYELQQVSNDLGYAVSQTIGEHLDRWDVGDQDWRNEVYYNLEGGFHDFVLDAISEAGDPPESA
jgi:hypothetical protein